MYFFSKNIRCRPVGWQLPASATVALFLTGCASQGPLKPPSLLLPKPAEKLLADRVGDHVELTWITPATTTDGENIKGAITANICLDTQPSAAASSKPPVKRSKSTPLPVSDTPCNAILHLPVSSGPSKASVPLSPALSTGSPRPIAYSVELVSARGKSAGPSAPVFVAAGEAPPPVGPLKVTPRRESAAIEWQPTPSSATVEVKRTLDGPATTPQKPKPEKSLSPFAPTSKEPAREITLRSDPSPKDPGGMIDPTVHEGDTYTYIAQRVATITIAGQKLELRSAPSPAATLTYHDVFPPKPPTGLVLIPGGGFGEPPSIDLSWDASFESDLLGYNIYRSSNGSAFTKLNPDPIPVPAFHDTHVDPGQQYTYRVTAIDKRTNESVPSITATESLRK